MHVKYFFDLKILENILFNVVFEQVEMEKYDVRRKCKTIVQVTSTWREAIRKILFRRGISFHFYRPLNCSSDSHSVTKRYPVNNMLPVHLCINEQQFENESLRIFLTQHSTDVVRITYTADEPLRLALNVINNANFINLRALIIFVTELYLAGSPNVDMVGLLAALTKSACKLESISYLNGLDTESCVSNSDVAISLPKSLRKLEMYTHRLDILKSCAFPDGLPNLAELELVCIERSQPCLCPDNHLGDILTHILQAACNSLQHLRIYAVGMNSTITIPMPPMSRLETLNIANVAISGFLADRCVRQFPMLQELVCSSCPRHTLEYLSQIPYPDLRIFRLHPNVTTQAYREIPENSTEISKSILTTIVSNIRNCSYLSISWKSPSEMKSGMKIILWSMPQLTQLKLNLGKEFQPLTTVQDLEQAFSGLQLDELEELKRNVESWSSVQYGKSSLHNLKGW